MSGSPVIHAGWGSSWKNLYQPEIPARTPRARKTPSVARRRRQWARQQDNRLMAGPSEGLQVFDDGILVRRRQRRAVGGAFVAPVAVARHGGVVKEVAVAPLLRLAGYEAHPGRVVEVVAAIEPGRAGGSRLQQVPQGRHR